VPGAGEKRPGPYFKHRQHEERREQETKRGVREAQEGGRWH